MDHKTILDIGEVTSFINKYQDDSLTLVRNILMSSNSYIMSSRDKTIYFILEGKTKTVGVMHVYVDPESRGREMLRFIREVREWTRENTEIRYVFNYTHDKKLKMLMPYFGSKKLGIWRGETVYRTEV